MTEMAMQICPMRAVHLTCYESQTRTAVHNHTVQQYIQQLIGKHQAGSDTAMQLYARMVTGKSESDASDDENDELELEAAAELLALWEALLVLFLLDDAFSNAASDAGGDSVELIECRSTF